MEDVGKLKSLISSEQSFNLFHNKSERIVDVYWIDYNSKCVKYTSLKPRLNFGINTFKTHPWIFRCQKTGQRMQANNGYVFWPREFKREPRPQHRDHTVIHFPMRSLKENVLWKIVEHTKDVHAFDDFEMPLSLRNELITRLKIKFEYTAVKPEVIEETR